MAVGLLQAIFLAPTEATMGDVQRIFYYHVPSAIMGLIFPYVNFLASLAYLFWRRRDPLKALAADALALASAEVTVVFVSIGLITGMLWGRAAWGIWWAWDARLTTYLLLWLLYVSYLLLRRFYSARPGQTLAAVSPSSPRSTYPSSTCRSAGGAPSIPRPSSAARPARPQSMYPPFFWNLAGWAHVGHLHPALPLRARAPPPA